METKNKRFAGGVLLIFTAVCALTYSARAGESGTAISLLAGGLLGHPNTSGYSSDTFAGKAGLAAGVLVEVPAVNAISFELGAFYLQRKWEDTRTTTGLLGSSTSTSTVTSPTIEIPALLRTRISSGLSLGLGGYGATGINKLNRDPGGDSSYGDQGMSNTDYGLMASVAMHLPLAGTSGVRIDTRYSLGLTNVATGSGQSFKYNDLLLLIGIQFGGGK